MDQQRAITSREPVEIYHLAYSHQERVTSIEITALGRGEMLLGQMPAHFLGRGEVLPVDRGQETDRVHQRRRQRQNWQRLQIDRGIGEDKLSLGQIRQRIGQDRIGQRYAEERLQIEDRRGIGYLLREQIEYRRIGHRQIQIEQNREK